jgi:MFS transporter, DHA2 family, multidrug resistance protein
MPFLFIPITTASYAGLPPDKTNEVASLINVGRNLGGSIGVSLATASLVQREQFHQARLAESIFPSSIQYQNVISQIAPYFTIHGPSLLDAQHRAIT